MYAGALTTGHLRHVVRLAMAAHGIAPDPAEYARERRLLEDAGRGILQELMREPAVAPALRRLRREDPQRWERVPKLLGLGARQTELLQRARHGSAHAGAAAALGGLFNAAIVLYDQLIDESDIADVAAAALGAGAVAQIFAQPDAAVPALRALANAHDDVRLKLFLLLTAECGRRGSALLSASGDAGAWRRLGALVQRLLGVHTAVSRGDADGIAAKSSLPSEVMFAIGALADGLSDDAAHDAAALGELAGALFSVADDLADLLIDIDCGASNTIYDELRATCEQGRIADADIYDAVVRATRRLADVLEQLEAQGARGFDVSALLAFARAMLAAWVDWPTEEPPAPPPVRAPRELQTAVDALLSSRRTGYADATHFLRFPRLDWTYETHPALTAQRTVILDALLDARDAGIPVAGATIAAETLAILRAKHRGVRGGWNYVPSVPELPPDADDLGQVLQALVRVGGADLAMTCDDGIRLLLDAAEPGGGLPTWILDPIGAGADDERIRAYLHVMGGWGVHPEVVANAAYGLLLYDRDRFARPLERAADFLAASQHAGGFWNSRWYAGPYYGTFKVLAFLARIAPLHPCLERAREFLVRSQSANGSWGDDGGDPLSTALAVLALGAVGGGEGEREALARGRLALANAQRDDGTWRAVPWIVFGSLAGEQIFESATITTAFCVKAIAARVHEPAERGARPLVRTV